MRGPSLIRLALVGALLGCADPRPLASDPVPPQQPPPTVALPPSEPAAEEPPAPPPPERAATLELTFVGDVVLGRYVSRKGVDSFREMHPPQADLFGEVAPLLSADVVVGNLESPVARELPPRPPIKHAHRFATSAAYMGQLQRGGFTVMSLANNHYYDLGLPGQIEGPQVLADAGIFAIGESRDEPPTLRVETLEVRGWRIGFLAFATLRNHVGDRSGPQFPLASLAKVDDDMLPLIAAARAEHDLLIVVVHWGTEYDDEVSYSRKQAARQLLEAGVDLVIGHHPHVLQAIERHRSGVERDGLIAYSLGNFVFPRSNPPSELSGVLRVSYRAGAPGERPCLERALLHPARILHADRWQTLPATGWKATQVRQRVTDLSKAHRTTLVRAPEPSEDLLVAGLRECDP